MIYIPRAIEPLHQYVKAGEVLVLYGPRRVGKTTLIEKLKDDFPDLRCRYETGDDIELQAYLSDQRVRHLLSFAAGLDLLVIDEAQNIPDIGQVLKIIVDQRPDLRVVVSGSASFELANQIGEPLTGRHHTLTLYPLAQLELVRASSDYEVTRDLENTLVYGSYPKVVTSATGAEKQNYLETLVSSYLFKDVLTFERVRSPKRIVDLLRLLAFQVGSEVSISELSRRLGMDQRTVMRYLDLFEKAFILYRLSGYSRNMRKEVTSKDKYYFYDNGIRNALIANFLPLDQRKDQGALWENFCLIERIKRNAYLGVLAHPYFWRTYDGQEIDYIEESNGVLEAVEFKYGNDVRPRVPRGWTANYPEAKFSFVNPDNFLDFVGEMPDDSRQPKLLEVA